MQHRACHSKPKLGLEVWGQKGVFRSFSRHPKTFRDCRLLVKKLDRNVWLLLESVADLTEGDQGPGPPLPLISENFKARKAKTFLRPHLNLKPEGQENFSVTHLRMKSGFATGSRTNILLLEIFLCLF